jgi:DNA-binding NtrC family response regulator
LIEGETGTGKEALARYLHGITPEAGGFQRYVCGAQGPAVIEKAPDVGQWIFLKYVDRLDRSAQEQLQAAIDSRWGGGDWQRLVSSASQPLETLVAQNRFSVALYHHLAGARISLPPLREHPSDIPELFDSFAGEFAGRAGMTARRVSSSLLEALMAYDWPGNVLELSNLAAIFAVSGNEADILEELSGRSAALQSVQPAPVPLKEQVRKASRELESGIILRTLESHRWNRRRAAESLNISYRSMLYKMKACNLRGENGRRVLR